MKVCELSGKRLDYWVARAEGFEYVDVPPDADGKHAGRALLPAGLIETGWQFPPKGPVGDFVPMYSAKWELAGEIIKRENIQISPPTSPVHRYGGPNAGNGQSGVWSACTWHRGTNGRRAIGHDENSPLIAAMRCFVTSKFGDEVSDEEAA